MKEGNWAELVEPATCILDINKTCGHGIYPTFSRDIGEYSQPIDMVGLTPLVSFLRYR